MIGASTTAGDHFLGPAVATRRGTGWAVLGYALVAALIGLRAWTDLHVPGHPELAHYGYADFRDAVYYPVVALLDGANPYDAVAYARDYPVTSTFALYGPHTLLLHLPLGLLSPHAAAAAYFALTLTLMPLVAVLALRLAGRTPDVTAVFALAALMLLSRPGQSNLFLGQYAATMAVAVALALRPPGTATWLVALGVALALMKPNYGLPLAVLLLARGEWRAVLGGGAAAALAAAVPAAVIVAHTGLEAPLALLTGNVSIFAAQPQFGTDSSVIRIDAASLVGRLAGAPPVAVQIALAALLLGVAAGGVAVAARAATRRARHAADALICLTLLTVVYHQSYDALLLALPLAWVCLAPAADAPPRRARLVLGLLLAIPLVNYAGSFAVVQRFGIEGWWWVVLTGINAAAILAAWALVAALTLQEPRP